MIHFLWEKAVRYRPYRWTVMIFAICVGCASLFASQIEPDFSHFKDESAQMLEEDRRAYEAATAALGAATSREAKMAATVARLNAQRQYSLTEASRDMPREYALIQGTVPDTFDLSANWEWVDDQKWQGVRAHTSADGEPHGLFGTSEFNIPPGAVLIQPVLMDRSVTEMRLCFLQKEFCYGKLVNRTFTVQWGGKQPFCRTDRVSGDTWEGPLPARRDAWVVLSVPVLDTGVLNIERNYKGIRFVSIGGKTLWGPTIIRRACLEIFPRRNIGLYRWGEKLEFDITVNAYETPVGDRIRWELISYDEELLASGEEKIRAESGESKTLYLRIPDSAYLRASVLSSDLESEPVSGYFTLRASLVEEKGEELERAETHAGYILPNRTGPDHESAFGMLVWDDPKDAWSQVGLRDQGVKHIFTCGFRAPFPRLGIITDFEYWIKPWSNRKEAEVVDKDPSKVEDLSFLQGRKPNPLLDYCGTCFWEVDLHNLPYTYGVNLRHLHEAWHREVPWGRFGTGALDISNIGFIHEMLAASGPGTCDQVICMGYITPQPPEEAGFDADAKILQQIFEKTGNPECELWSAEWGYFDFMNLDGGYWLHAGTPHNLLPAYMIREHLVLLDAGWSRCYPNSTGMGQGGASLFYQPGHGMFYLGSTNPDGSLWPLPVAYSVMTRMLEGKRKEASIDVGERVYCVDFQAFKDSWKQLGSAPRVLAIWAQWGVRQITISVPQEPVVLVSMTGARRVLEPINGRITFPVTQNPQYLLLADSHASVARAGAYFECLQPEIEVVADEPARFDVTYQVRNFTEVPLQAQVHMEPLAGCTFSPAPVQEVVVEPAGEAQVTFSVEMSADNRVLNFSEMPQVAGWAHHVLRASLRVGDSVIGIAGTVIRTREPFQILMRPSLETLADQESPKLNVHITNRSSKPRHGRLQMRSHAEIAFDRTEVDFEVGAGSSTEVSFKLSGKPLPVGETTVTHIGADFIPREESRVVGPGEKVPISDHNPIHGYLESFGIGEGYVLEAVARCEDGTENRQSRGFAFFPAPCTSGPLQIDGKDTDWADVPRFDFSKGRWIALPHDVASLSGGGGDLLFDYFTGRDDCAAQWACQWDERFLYFLFVVQDNRHHNEWTGHDLWAGDSVRFTLDPSPEETDNGLMPEPRNPASFYTFDLALTPLGPQFYRRYPARGCSAGLVSAATLAIGQVKAKVPSRHPIRDTETGRFTGAWRDVESEVIRTTYELALPWQEIQPLEPKVGAWFGLSIVVGDSDGYGRKTWTSWFGGLHGNGLAREPKIMGDVHLVGKR